MVSCKTHKAKTKAKAALAADVIYAACLDACRTDFRSYAHALSRGRFILDAPHTIGICDELQAATEAIERGECYYVVITCPPQHGKSALCSELYPPWHIGRNKDHRVMLASYGADLAKGKSRIARGYIDTPETKEIFGIDLDPFSHAVEDWHIKHYLGGLCAVGLGGTITGRGADVIIIDDYLKGREEAESASQRAKIWASFTNDIMTRRAPAHAIIIIATRWHGADLIGRIKDEMKRNPDFPSFKFIEYPAQSEKYITPDSPEGWLFPQRYSPQFYRTTKALDKYAWNSLYMCNPTKREGGIFKTDCIEWLDVMPEGLPFVRFWDLASTRAERTSDNPSYTAGTKLAVTREKDCFHIWIADVERFREEAPERNEKIKAVAIRDGGIPVAIEQVGPYKDSVITIRKLLAGISTVAGIQLSGDKVFRAEPIEPIMTAGHVHVLRGNWNDAWIDELDAFPSAPNDDQVDSLSGGYKTALMRFEAVNTIVPQITIRGGRR